jgi:L-alanine-DL-glutamate epimerase-like enolase superfamily enzyme
VCEKPRQVVKVPLATGEGDRTIWEVPPYLQHQAGDSPQPHAADTDGITRMRKVAVLTTASYTSVGALAAP